MSATEEVPSYSVAGGEIGMQDLDLLENDWIDEDTREIKMATYLHNIEMPEYLMSMSVLLPSARTCCSCFGKRREGCVPLYDKLSVCLSWMLANSSRLRREETRGAFDLYLTTIEHGCLHVKVC